MALVQHELVGRSAEQSAITEFLSLGPDAARCLLLVGEPGIGKTTLWRAARSEAGALGYRLLSSAPTEVETGLPHAVLGDLLYPVPEEAIASLPGPLRTALEVALFRAPARQGATDQLAVSTAFLRVLRHLAADNGLLLALDDIQWIDGPSMRVLAFALRRLEREPVKVLAAHRVPSAGDAASILHNALGAGRVHRIEIGPLSRDGIDDLLLQRLDRPLRQPEFDQVYAVSGGNPFFALEVGQFILEHPTTVKAGEPIPVPRSLADAIRGRITKLPPETRDILTALAALSRPDEALLERADPHALAALDAAFAAQVVERAQGRLRFTHPLLASVIYSMADAAKRRRWHARLAGLVTDPEERARHLALAATSADATVADALEEAARSANLRGAPDMASMLGQQASELTPAEFPASIERRRIMTAQFRMRAGDVPGARDLLRSVLQSAPVGQRPAEALRLMGSLTLGGEDLLEAESFLMEALSQSGVDLYTRAMIERDLITVFNQRGMFQDSVEHSNRLTEIANRLDDPSITAVAQRFKMVTERHVGRQSPESIAIAVAIADGRISLPMDDTAGGLHPLMHWGAALKWSDDFAHARALLKRVLSLTEGRDESLRAPVLLHLAEMEFWAGDWLLAALYVDECEKSVAHTGHRSYARLSLNAKAMLHCGRGEFDAAREAAQEALAISNAIGDEPYLRRALSILGATELAAGNPAAANEYFELLRVRGNHIGYRGSIRSESDEVDALMALGQFSEAAAVGARMAEFDDPWQLAIGARCRALLASARGDFDASVSEFETAMRAHELLPMPLERARTLLAYGSVLRRAKQKRAAREKLEEALPIFRSLGAPAWIKRAESELSRIAPPPAGGAELTPTEGRIAQLVSNGRTNKEVANELFLSVKTVEANLSRIYAKLNVRSRTELVARRPSPR